MTFYVLSLSLTHKDFVCHINITVYVQLIRRNEINYFFTIGHCFYGYTEPSTWEIVLGRNSGQRLLSLLCGSHPWIFRVPTHHNPRFSSPADRVFEWPSVLHRKANFPHAMASFPLQGALFTLATFFPQLGNFPPLLTRLSTQSSQVFNFKTLILLLRWTISLLEWPGYQLQGLAIIVQGPVSRPSSKGPVTTSTDLLPLWVGFLWKLARFVPDPRQNYGRKVTRLQS